MSFEECLNKKLLVRIKSDKELAKKEFLIAEKDLERAKQTFEITKDTKWTIIQAYYSMFHSAKAILYLIGIKERSHGCIFEVLKKLSEKGLIQSYIVDEFESSRSAREDADYRDEYTENTAERIIENAEEFLQKMQELSSKIRQNEI